MNSWPEKIGNIVIHSCLWTDCIYNLFRIRTEIQSHKFNKAKTLTLGSVFKTPQYVGQLLLP